MPWGRVVARPWLKVCFQTCEREGLTEYFPDSDVFCRLDHAFMPETVSHSCFSGS